MEFTACYYPQLELTPPGAAEFVICDHTIEFLFRDAKQFAGLTDYQARSQAKLTFYSNASLSAVTLAKLKACQQHRDTVAAFPMASLKRRTFNQHLIERIVQHLAKGHSLEKSSPNYEELCNYGIITETAACILIEVSGMAQPSYYLEDLRWQRYDGQLGAPASQLSQAGP